jgi:hypothetical protein
MTLKELKRDYHRIDWNYFPEWGRVNAYVKALEQEISDKDEKIRITEAILKSYEKKIKL